MGRWTEPTEERGDGLVRRPRRSAQHVLQAGNESRQIELERGADFAQFEEVTVLLYRTSPLVGPVYADCSDFAKP